MPSYSSMVVSGTPTKDASSRPSHLRGENSGKKKFAANAKRDARSYAALLARGWRVLVVWECALRTRKGLEGEQAGIQVMDWLNSESDYGEIDGAALDRLEEGARHEK